MKRLSIALFLLAALGCGSSPEAEAPEPEATAQAERPLEIYWIDVEGGAATLVVTPEGKTVLMDAGWPGAESRDPKRIEHVLKNVASREKIDYFITSHFHLDHIGGLPELAELVEIDHFVDHGDSMEIEWEGEKGDRPRQLWDGYTAAAGDKRMQVKPGDKLPFGDVDFEFVAARGEFVETPVGMQPNPACESTEPKDMEVNENDMSVGFLVRLGDFEFLDLGDLTWNKEIEIACPESRLPEIDLYQVTHHGMHMSGAPAHIEAIAPQVAVMNNGHRKGGRPETYETLTALESLADLWQVHKALTPEGAPNTDEQMIANLEATDEGDQGHWIKASVEASGAFTLTNSRNDFSKTYQARP